MKQPDMIDQARLAAEEMIPFFIPLDENDRKRALDILKAFALGASKSEMEPTSKRTPPTPRDPAA